MLRSDQLVFCKRCQNRHFDIKKGVVCSITNEQAIFNSNCKDFILDQKASDIEDREAELKQKIKKEEETAGLSSLGIKNGISAGILIIASCFAYCILSIYLFGGIPFLFVPLILLTLGLVTLIKGVVAKNKAKKSTDSLDDGLMD